MFKILFSSPCMFIRSSGKKPLQQEAPSRFCHILNQHRLHREIFGTGHEQQNRAATSATSIPRIPLQRAKPKTFRISRPSSSRQSNCSLDIVNNINKVVVVYIVSYRSFLRNNPREAHSTCDRGI